MRKIKEYLGGKLLLTLTVITSMFLVAAVPVLAAEEEETSVYEEEAVVVTATRTKQQESKAPGRTEVITKEEIEASGAATVAEVLTNTGVVAYHTGGASGLVYAQLDGAEPEQTLVLINGVPVNSGSGGKVDLSYFPTAGISRIEIAHGPLSALYGANALGGVVNIITDLTGDTVNRATVTGGSNTYGQLDLAIQQQQYGFAIGGLTTDGHRTNSDTKNGYLMGQYDFWQTEQKELRLNFLYNTKDYESPGSVTYPSTIDNGTKKNLAVDLMGKNVLNQFNIEYKLYAQNYEYDYNSSTTTHYKTNIYGSDLAVDYQLAAHQLLGGLQLNQEQSSRNDIDHTWHNGAVFFQDNWELNSKWQLLSGVRWDTGSVYSSPICPRVGLIYAATEQFTAKLGYGKAFREPTFDDLYFPGSGNPNLKPENSERYEITGEWRNGTQMLSLNCYRSKVVDGIAWNEVNGVWNPYNIAKMKVNGSSFQWQTQLNQYLSTGFKYIWTDRRSWDKDTQSYSKNENSYGKNRYTLNFRYKHNMWSSNLNCNRITDRNNNRPDYTVLDLNVKYQVNQKLNYGLTINNLTDKDYQVIKGYPMPGREYYLSANYTF
jgi:outer membrane cobalamin receptor